MVLECRTPGRMYPLLGHSAMRRGRCKTTFVQCSAFTLGAGWLEGRRGGFRRSANPSEPPVPCACHYIQFLKLPLAAGCQHRVQGWPECLHNMETFCHRIGPAQSKRPFSASRKGQTYSLDCQSAICCKFFSCRTTCNASEPGCAVLGYDQHLRILGAVAMQISKSTARSILSDLSYLTARVDRPGSRSTVSQLALLATSSSVDQASFDAASEYSHSLLEHLDSHKVSVWTSPILDYAGNRHSAAHFEGLAGCQQSCVSHLGRNYGTSQDLSTLAALCFWQEALQASGACKICTAAQEGSSQLVVCFLEQWVSKLLAFLRGQGKSTLVKIACWQAVGSLYGRYSLSSSGSIRSHAFGMH